MAILVGSLVWLTDQGMELMETEVTEVKTTAAILLWMSQDITMNGGHAMCASQVGHIHIWLGLYSLKER